MGKEKEYIILIHKAFKEGDQEAFGVIFKTYYERLYVYVNSFTHDRYKTEDIIQDTFLKVWSSRDNYDINQSISNYLYKIAYHLFIDSYRKHMQNLKMLDSFAHNKIIELDKDEEKSTKKINRIRKVVEQLPPKCKTIFLMSKYQGYKYSEIANELGISVKTVENQIGKAFKILRREIKGKGFINLFW